MGLGGLISSPLAVLTISPEKAPAFSMVDVGIQIFEIEKLPAFKTKLTGIFSSTAKVVFGNFNSRPARPADSDFAFGASVWATGVVSDFLVKVAGRQPAKTIKSANKTNSQFLLKCNIFNTFLSVNLPNKKTFLSDYPSFPFVSSSPISR